MQYVLSLMIDDLFVYANQNQHTNTRDADANKLLSRSQALRASYVEATAFIAPEIAQIDETVLNKMATSTRLKTYNHLFDNILRTKTHIRSQEVESVLAAASLLRGAPSGIYSALTSADISWPTIKGEDGKDATVMPALFYTYIKELIHIGPDVSGIIHIFCSQGIGDLVDDSASRHDNSNFFSRGIVINS